ncbi:UDP-glucose dehydrogenase family protein [Halalkalibacter okhensis]|uniref:UDP-glucose 6-dehydrogenase n=1 Tax=Halalkalibacter okhensis TaxID=333138 RepID=A0A0B0ID15_9BACI|nr:UDP-glucose/GDP-mannose dehydrogenase family protein [Halalkalibacter okhensis]KHF40453.1 UDP-glucose 6-dehydrogenase [Halalkalibacter okhensis]
MDVCVIGAGYVGLTTSTVLANYGHQVYCVDKQKDRVEMLRNGKVPIYEPGLEEMLVKNSKKGQLIFTTDLKTAVSKSDVIFIAVGTPQDMDGRTDLRFFEGVINELAPLIKTYKIVITKSTVPLGTNEELEQKLLEQGVLKENVDVVSNPEFLREGTAIHDMLYPDKIVIGMKEQRTIQVLQKLYHFIDAPYIITSLSGAEMIKYASNAFLAVKISFINELAKIADAYEVDITDVALGIGMDPRIGHHFLQAGLGYGGSCLPKDLSSLEHQSIKKNIAPHLLQAAQTVNDSIIDHYLNKLKTEVPDYQKKKITVWGATFKPNTDDLRHSQALKLINRLVDEGSNVHLYDPIVSLKIDNTSTYQDMFDSVKDTDILIVATEWKQFIDADWKKVSAQMRGKIVLDCRNCLQPYTLRKNGLLYLGVARP